jgi:hypothetical protein
VPFPALVAIAAQDMPNRVWGNFYPLPAKVNSEPASAKAGLLASLNHQFLNLFWCFTRGMKWTAGFVF